MSNRWWNPFDGMEQIAFKPVSEGYVYRAPNPWLIGRSQYYLVNEMQKTELVVHHRRTMQLTFWMIVAAAGIGAPLLGWLVHGHAWITLAVSAAIGLAIGLSLNMLLVRKVEPIVGRLSPTNIRITQHDAFKTQLAVFSPRYVLGFAALDFALLALVVWGATSGPRGWDVMAVVGASLFGFGMAYFLALYVAKLRQAKI